jgi:hypothetical protein
LDSRKELFEVLKSGHFITVLNNKTVQMKDVKEVVTTMDIPHAESIDFNKRTLLVEPSDQNFMLIFNNRDSSTIVHFNKVEKKATWSVALPNTELTFFSILKNGYCILGRKDIKPLLFQYENDRLMPIEHDLPLNNTTQLTELPDGNMVALSNEGQISLLDSKFEKQKEVAIPEFSPSVNFKLFTSPYKKIYATSYLDNHFRFSAFNINDLKLDKAVSFDLSGKKKCIYDHIHWRVKFCYPAYSSLLSNRYIVFIERENFCIDPLFPDRLWRKCETTSDQENYWLSIFDLCSEQLLIESELITSIPSAKLNRFDAPPGRISELPRDYLFISALPDGRLIASHHINKSRILDDNLRNKYQEFMIFDPLKKECLREDALKALEKITIPPLAKIMADYAGLFAIKHKEYKDIPIEYTFKNDSCTIL